METVDGVGNITYTLEPLESSFCLGSLMGNTYVDCDGGCKS